MYLVNDRLHVALVFVVSIEQRGPLLRADAQPRLHGHANDLAVVFTPKTLVHTELSAEVTGKVTHMVEMGRSSSSPRTHTSPSHHTHSTATLTLHIHSSLIHLTHTSLTLYHDLSHPHHYTYLLTHTPTGDTHKALRTFHTNTLPKILTQTTPSYTARAKICG